LLIINADDFGMYHASTIATIQAWREGVVRSTTLMTPCPYGLYAMHLLKENPDFPFGVHLTLVAEQKNYKWGPRASREQVRSLVDESGYFFSYERIPELLEQAKIDEVETEFRAQIETVLAFGLHPTHLDWHCIHNAGRADMFDLTIALAKEYGLAMRASAPAPFERLQEQGLPTNDHQILDSFRLDTIGKTDRYVQLLRELPAGLTEWAVHPSLGNDEARAIDDGWPVRRADFDFLISRVAKDTIVEEGIVLLDYRALQAVWNQADN
jgi:predicted glycoside hydrolase/deacetylase ChbG (UPF0249 family)